MFCSPQWPRPLGTLSAMQSCCEETLTWMSPKLVLPHVRDIQRQMNFLMQKDTIFPSSKEVKKNIFGISVVSEVLLSAQVMFSEHQTFHIS